MITFLHQKRSQGVCKWNILWLSDFEDKIQVKHHLTEEKSKSCFNFKFAVSTRNREKLCALRPLEKPVLQAIFGFEIHNSKIWDAYDKNC